MKKEKTMMALYAGCLAVLCACTESQELSNKEGIDEPVELQINPTMTLTGGGARDASTSNFVDNATIGVFAAGTGSAYGNGNNYAVYKHSGTEANGWSVNGDKHIYLTSEVATIYAVSPSTGITAPTNAVSATSTVNIGTFVGEENNIDTDSKNLITAAQSATNDINIALGETDYLYAGGTHPEANNGKGSDPKSTSVDLTMDHALAMVSFRVYRGANYKGDGHLTKIQMKNATGSSSWRLQQAASGGSATMQIGDGTIDLGGNPQNITYTRFIHQTRADETSDGGAKYCELKEKATGPSATPSVPAFGILLYPIAASSDKTTDIEIVFTVDATDYTVPLGKETTQVWAKGTNSIYEAILDGEELSLGNVTITDWQSTTINNGLNLIQKP